MMMFAAIKKGSFAGRVALCALMVSSFSKAFATESGGSSYPHGIENYVLGALPPPGFYGITYAQHYYSTDLKNNDGDTIPIPFKASADVIAQRFVWSSNYQIAGGNFAAHMVIPIVHLDAKLGALEQSKTGLGDIPMGVGIGWHHNPYLHSIAGTDVILPTGDYDKNDLANTGRNYLAIEPYYAISYINPAGFNGDIRIAYLFNRRNRATDYKSGQEFHFDYALGWGLGNGWTLGVGGYYYQQTTDDKFAGTEVQNFKGRAFAIGPNIKYDTGKGILFALKWQQESIVRNRPEGNAVWLKAVFPL